MPHILKTPFFYASLLVAVVILLLAFWLVPGFGPSKQADFPDLGMPANLDFVGGYTPPSLTSQIRSAKLVVDGTIKKIWPNVEPENRNDSITYFKIKINGIIEGQHKGKMINFYFTPLMNCCRYFKVGDRLVLMLFRYGDGYAPTCLQSSIYFVSYDQKVYPGVLSSSNRHVSGESLNAFEKEIKAKFKKA